LEGDENTSEDNSSDCESVDLGEEVPVPDSSENAEFEPPVSFEPASQRKYEEVGDSGSESEGGEEGKSYMPPSVASTLSFDPLRSPFPTHTANAMDLPATGTFDK
jgi:hypothetical protein